MILSDGDIHQEISRGTLKVDPLGEGAVGPSSIDLTLSSYLHVFDPPSVFERVWDYIDDIDPKKDQSGDGRPIEITETGYLLRPYQFCLASIRERFTLPSHLAAQIEGKSSLGRLGLLVHVTAGFIDAGFDGYPTLELFNVRDRPFRVYPGMPIAQMAIFAMRSSADLPYDQKSTSKYRGQGAAPQPSLYHLNFRR